MALSALLAVLAEVVVQYLALLEAQETHQAHHQVKVTTAEAEVTTAAVALAIPAAAAAVLALLAVMVVAQMLALAAMELHHPYLAQA